MKKEISIARYVKIALDISRKILLEEFKVDEILKGRSILASDYKVSPETVRKAMNLLDEEGVVETRPGVGVFVKDIIKAEEFVNKFKADRSIRQQEDEIKILLAEKEALDKKINAGMNELIESFKYRTTESIMFYDIELLEGSKLIGQTIGQVQFWKNTGATIVAIVHEDFITVSPGPEAVLYAGDLLVVVGDEGVVARCETFMDEGIAVEQMTKKA